MSLVAKALGSVGALAVGGPIIHTITQDVAARAFHKDIPAAGDPYPNPVMSILRGAPTNTSLFGVIAFGAVFGAGTLYARVGLLSGLHRQLKHVELWQGRAEPPKITTFKGLLVDFTPTVTVWALAALAAVAPASIAKAYVDGPGRFANFASYKGNPYRAQLAAAKEMEAAKAAGAAAAAASSHH